MLVILILPHYSSWSQNGGTGSGSLKNPGARAVWPRLQLRLYSPELIGSCFLNQCQYIVALQDLDLEDVSPEDLYKRKYSINFQPHDKILGRLAKYATYLQFLNTAVCGRSRMRRLEPKFE